MCVNVNLLRLKLDVHIRVTPVRTKVAHKLNHIENGSACNRIALVHDAVCVFHNRTDILDMSSDFELVSKEDFIGLTKMY